jgi:uncharacterized phage protein gp47/JayE
VPYTVKSAQELRAVFLRTLAAYLPAVPTAPGTFAYLEGAAFARLVADVMVRLDELDRNATPLTASEAGLAIWAELLDVPRGGASGASRSQALRVNGAVGAVIPANTTLTHRTGQQYEIPSAVTIPASGTALADCRALGTGTATNITAGEALRFDTPPTDISPASRLELDLLGGTDEEPLGQWRARVVQRFRIAVQGGTRSDYEAWMLAALDTVRFLAFVYPNKPTVGTVSVCGALTRVARQRRGRRSHFRRRGAHAPNRPAVRGAVGLHNPDCRYRTRGLPRPQHWHVHEPDRR